VEVGTTEEVAVVGINVGSDAKGGKVGVGRNELMDPFAGTVITSDCRQNCVEIVVGMYVMVRRVVCVCGRSMTDRDPREELKMAQTAVPSAERVIFMEALEKGPVVRKRLDA